MVLNVATRPAVVAAVPSARSKWTGLTLAVALGAGIALLPTPEALSRPAHLVLAIAAFAIVMWVFQVMNNGIVSVLMMGLMILAGVRPALALSAFAGAQFWILLAVLYYGFAMQKTGLAQRLSYYILSLFPATYQGILWAFFLIGLAVALLADRISENAGLWYLIPVGFIGAYTTFSAFELELLEGLRAGDFLLASLNLFLSVVLGLLAVALGLLAGRAMA